MVQSRQVTWLKEETSFPHPSLARQDGLIAIGGDLSPERLLNAYHQGIFPWSARPTTWWSPDPRAIIDLQTFHIPKTIARLLKQNYFEVTHDEAFLDVMLGCAERKPGREDTWISEEFMEAYGKLFRMGYAHSVECWFKGRLVGGIYGVCIDSFFAGESMFYRVSNASNVALVHLLIHLKQKGFLLFDTQMVTAHTKRFGAKNIPRSEYLKRLETALSIKACF